MRRTSLAMTLLAGSVLAASAIAAQGVPENPEATFAASVTLAMATPGATGLPEQDAVAVAVIGALQSQFGGRDVEFRIEALDAERVSARDVALAGRGDIRIQGSGAWLPVHFQALYDTTTLTVLSPSISLDRGQAGANGGIDPSRLEVEVAERLSDEFASQEVTFALAGTDLVGGDARYALMTGHGVADFGVDGETPVQLEAVYDREAATWVSVEYTLDGASLGGESMAAL